MRLARHFLALAVLCGSYHVQASAPLGEEASYALDRARGRTSAVIKSGSIGIKVTDLLNDEARGPVYRTEYSYDLTIAFMGRQQGTNAIKLSSEYFEPAFIERLRAEGDVTTDAFKARYLGQGDATILDGTVYEECDLIELYDIDLEKLGNLVGFVAPLLAGLGNPTGEEGDGVAPAPIEQLKVKAAIKQGAVPVIGAVKVDVSGIKNGFPIKAGFDYQPQAGQEQP